MTDSPGIPVTPPPATTSTPALNPPSWRPRWRLVFFAAAVVSGTVLWQLRDPLPIVTRDLWEQQRQRWEDSGTRDYRIQIRVTGRQGARYDVVVRDGIVQQALRNGESLGSGPALATWSVPGMFATLRLDLEAQERAARSGSESRRPSLLLRCRFDPLRGYPQTYQRIEWGEGSTNPDVSWTVDRFELLSP
ncbi:MAG: hypothetical protein U0935_02825 [Pirellulales bacterium]